MRFTRLLISLAGSLLLLGLLDGFVGSPDVSGRLLPAPATSRALVDETLPAQGWYEAIAELSTPRIAFLGSDENIWLISSSGGDRVRITGSSAVTALAWSPDGTQIAYISQNDLFVVDLPHESRRQLTHSGDLGSFALTWSNDDQIAFVQGSKSIAAVDAADQTAEIKTLVKDVPFRGYGIHNPSTFPSLSWSPDSSVVTFDIYPSYGFGLADLKNTSYQKIAGWRPTWSPATNELVYASDGEIRIVDTSQGEDSLVLQSPDGTYAFPTFSPDGNRIAYTWSLAAAGADNSLWVYDRLQERRTRLYPGHTAELAWSPSGQRLAFTRWAPTEGFFQFAGIYIVDEDGTNVRELAPDGHSPQWQPKK